MTKGHATDNPGAEPLEIEVKLGVSRPRRIAALLRNPDPTLLAGFEPAQPIQQRMIVDRYLDTDEVDGRLATSLMRVRLRQHGRLTTLTVKRSGTETNGVTERVEMEAPATREIDPERWPDSAARTALIEAVGTSRLSEVARLRQHRLVRVVRRGRTTIELSLDRVDAIVLNRLVERRYELEAELMQGDREDLAELAGALVQLDGVGPPAGSKLAFALAARAAATP